MVIPITIPDKIYNKIVNYCKDNSIDINDYIIELISKIHISNVYGELPLFMETKKVNNYQKDIQKNVDDNNNCDLASIYNCRGVEETMGCVNDMDEKRNNEEIEIINKNAVIGSQTVLPYTTMQNEENEEDENNITNKPKKRILK